MKTVSPGIVLPLGFLLALGACGGSPEVGNDSVTGIDAAGHAGDGPVTLSPEQISSAGVQIERALVGGAATIDVPGIIEGDARGMQVVSAAIGGRIVALTRNLGQSVGRGQTLAVIESREAAQLKGAVEASRARLALAVTNLAREKRLFDQLVSPEQDFIAARTAAIEARIAYRQAQGQVSAAGSGGVGLNRLAIAAPIAGRVVSRSVVLGQTVAADGELYRVADLDRVSLALNLRPQDAALVTPGNIVTVKAAGRQGRARISFVSPALDPQTRQVPVIATLDNKTGQWRIGEPVTATIQLGGTGSNPAVRVPTTAVQTVDGKPVVFVRTANGFQATPVTVGDAAGDTAIIRSGLSGREQIATTSSFTLKAELGKGDAGHEE